MANEDETPDPLKVEVDRIKKGLSRAKWNRRGYGTVIAVSVVALGTSSYVLGGLHGLVAAVSALTFYFVEPRFGMANAVYNMLSVASPEELVLHLTSGGKSTAPKYDAKGYL